MSKPNWNITAYDLEKTMRFKEKERIKPLTSDNMFKGGVYCILSARENYLNQVRRCRKLEVHGVITPDAIKKCPQKVWGILGNGKSKEIIEYAKWWPASGLTERIIEDLANGHEQEFDIRKKIRRECPGMAYKCASLFMRKCGYGRSIPMDIWALRFLRDMGHDVNPDDYYSSKRSPSDSAYLHFESLLSQHAVQLGIPPADFQLAIWIKNHVAADGNQMHFKSTLDI